MPDYSNRPRPVKAAANRLSAILGAIGAIVTTLATWGAISAVQHDSVNGLLDVVAVAGPGILAAVTAVLAAFGVVKRAEPLVTPLSDPRGKNGTPLFTHSPPGDGGSGLSGG